MNNSFLIPSFSKLDLHNESQLNKNYFFRMRYVFNK